MGRRSTMHALARATLAALASSCVGCIGVFVDLHAVGYPTLHTALHPSDVVLPPGPRPIEEVKAGAGIGVTLGAEIDDGRTSRWAVGYSEDAIETTGGASARQHFNDLRVDVTVKTFDDDDLLRLAVGGGIGAGNNNLPRDDGGTFKQFGGSARVYGGPTYVRYVGNHSAFSAMLGGAFLIIGAGDFTVRGWGLATHLTYTYSLDDSHADVVMYRALPPTISIGDYALAGERIGCVARFAEDEAEDVVGVYLSCPDGLVEIHAPQDMVHIHCERSTTDRCRALYSRIEAALYPIAKKPPKDTDSSPGTRR